MPSPERIDNESGYSPDNCVAICGLFQTGDASRNKPQGPLSHEVAGTNQWSLRKFSQVPMLATQAESEIHRAWLDGQIKMASGDLCAGGAVNRWRARRGGRNVCELSRWIQFKIGDRHAIARRRKWTASQDDIDVIWLLQAVSRTRLRCEYTNITMSITPCSDWICSIERVDNGQGYTKQNTKLVCHEFNHRWKWTAALVSEVWGIAQLVTSQSTQTAEAERVSLVAWDEERAWCQRLEQLTEFKEKRGHMRVPKNHVLYTFVQNARVTKNLSPTRQQLLQSIGFNRQDRVNDFVWDRFLAALQAYVTREGHCCVPGAHKEDGFYLGRALSKVQYRAVYIKNKPTRLKALEDLGVHVTR